MTERSSVTDLGGGEFNPRWPLIGTVIIGGELRFAGESPGTGGGNASEPPQNEGNTTEKPDVPDPTQDPRIIRPFEGHPPKG